MNNEGQERSGTHDDSPPSDQRSVARAARAEGPRAQVWVRVAALDDLPDGRVRTVLAGKHSLALTRVGDQYGALDNHCPHQGGPLGEGELAGTVVTCPWHEWRFDVRTGVNTDDATCKVQSYPVKLDGADILVQL